MWYNIIRKKEREHKVPHHQPRERKEVIKMFATIITIIVAVPAIMNAIGIDWEDIADWFANGRITL